jgi:hypothetical protein
MPRIFDAFVLNDELGILETRFADLASVPGLVHVICEAPVTFRGSPKPLHFWEARDTRFACWRGRWNHVRVEAHEMGGRTPAAREAAQREYLLHGITGEPGDIIVYGDVADIPDPADLEDLARRKTAPLTMPGPAVACYCRDVGSLAELEELRLQSPDGA